MLSAGTSTATAISSGSQMLVSFGGGGCGLSPLDDEIRCQLTCGLEGFSLTRYLPPAEPTVGIRTEDLPFERYCNDFSRFAEPPQTVCGKASCLPWQLAWRNASRDSERNTQWIAFHCVFQHYWNLRNTLI